MSEPRILLVVGGGIAAYKSCELVRLIRKGGGDVTCVLTNGGAQFVTPMALAALSGNQVHTSLWDLKNEAEIGHIQLSRDADLVVVCPATADLLAKMNAGIADDLGTTMLLATDKPVLAVPAMNVRMWEHEATKRNIAQLRKAGVTVMQPDEGAMACGEFGPGRLPEPEAVWLEIAALLNLDLGEANAQQIADFLRAVEPEDEDGSGDGGALSGMLGALIQRSEPHREGDANPEIDGLDWDELDKLSPEEFAAFAKENGIDLDNIGPALPDPENADAPAVLARKGAAAAAPPTDREAINHQVNARQSAPQPFEGEDAAAPVSPGSSAPDNGVKWSVMGPEARRNVQARSPDNRAKAVGTIAKGRVDPLEGQPAFDQSPEHRPLYGKHVLVTAGPTHEAIDPVRYLANRSSGKQGFAIAAAAAAAGARVTLVTGPVWLETPPGVDRIDVESAVEMAQEVKNALPVDCAVMVAAVADWRTRDYRETKLKKRGAAPPALLLTENPDILAMVGAHVDRPQLLIGFAAETDNLIENARKKRKAKGADWIVANDVSGDVMGGDNNKVHIVREKKVEDWEPMSKVDVAWKLVEAIADELETVDG